MALNSYVKRLHHRVGWMGIICLMLPVVILVWPVAEKPVLSVFSGGVPSYVLSGKLFSEQFQIIHAGFVLDQPTIGKWLFWFSVMAMVSLPHMLIVRWISDRSNPAGYWAYAIPVMVLGVFLLCVLSWPVCWLIQYVHSMGLTPKRIYGLIYAVAGGILIAGFLYWALKKPEKDG